MKKSTLTKNQKQKFSKKINEHETLVVTVRYDDECMNGHNTFAITADLYDSRVVRDNGIVAAGCLHGYIEKHFPELSHLIKWHLCSSDGPLNYVADTMYHAKEISPHQDKFHTYMACQKLGISNVSLGINTSENVDLIMSEFPTATITTEEWLNSSTKKPDLEAGRNSAVWEDATIEQLRDEVSLIARLPDLLERFKSDMEEQGFIW